MVVLRLLNLMAPFYFLCLLAVTFCLQTFVFLPGLCDGPSLPLTGLLHGSLFLFFLVNVIGNYFLVIWNSPAANAAGNADMGAADKAFCQICARMMWDREHHCFFTGTCIGRRNLRSFVLFCLHASASCFHALVSGAGYVSNTLSLSFLDPATFLRLLPLSVTRFFSGSLLSSEMLAVLMLYLWLGVGLACAAFCCHQLLLISRTPAHSKGPTEVTSPINWTANLRSVFGKRWLLAILVPRVKEE